MDTLKNGAIVIAFVIPAAIAPAYGQTPWALGPLSGAYVGVEGGYTDLLTATNRGFNITQGPNQGLNATSVEQFRGGYNIGGRAGFEWGPWRLEGEVNYRSKNLGRGVREISPTPRIGRAQNAERHSVS